MDDLIKKALTAERESKRIEFKECFDTGSDHDWCEVIKDIVAMANSGGGVLVFGLDSFGVPTGRGSGAIGGIDPADIMNRVAKYTGAVDLEFEIREVRKKGRGLIALLIRAVPIPLVFERPGTYSAGSGKQRTAFGVGTLYFRHGAKSEPGSTRDVQKIVERRLEAIRKSWAKGLRSVIQAPAGSEVLVAHPPTGSRRAPYNPAPAVRVVSDPKARPVYVTRDPGRSSVTLVHEEISEGIFDEINNVIDANRTLARDRQTLLFGEPVYYRIYAERQYVRQKDKDISLLLRSAMTEFYTPALYWILSLPEGLAGDILAEVLRRPRHPQIHQVLRLAVLLGDSFCNWLGGKLDDKWGGYTQPPQFYWSFKEAVKKAKDSGPLIAAARLNPASEVCVPAEAAATAKELIENPQRASALLSRTCVAVFQGNANHLRTTARALDYLAYGAEVITRAGRISAAVTTAFGNGSVGEAAESG